jgi:hypothetical protein
MLTQERLKEKLYYVEDQGFFRWRSTWKIAGTAHNAGYFHIGIDYEKYLVHRLVWLYVHGYMPKEIDHIDQDPKNNRLSNLREVTRQQNKLNDGPQRNNTSGHRGIDFLEKLGKYRVRVAKEHLGVFSTLEEAIAIRDKVTARYFR